MKPKYSESTRYISGFETRGILFCAASVSDAVLRVLSLYARGFLYCSYDTPILPFPYTKHIHMHTNTLSFRTELLSINTISIEAYSQCSEPGVIAEHLSAVHIYVWRHTYMLSLLCFGPGRNISADIPAREPLAISWEGSDGARWPRQKTWVEEVTIDFGTAITAAVVLIVYILLRHVFPLPRDKWKMKYNTWWVSITNREKLFK